MENIFNEIIISNHFFDQKLNIKQNLFYYIQDNLENENYNTFFWHLRRTLAINGKFIY